MITEIRGYLKGGAYKVMLWVVVAMLAFSSLPMILRKANNEGQWVFRINDQEISKTDYIRELERQRAGIAHARSQYGEYADMILGAADPHQFAKRVLLDEELLNQVAHSIGIHIDHEFITEKLYEQLPDSLITETGSIDQKSLRKLLERQGLTIRDFEHKLERTIAQQAVSDIASVAYYVPLFELRPLYIARYVDKKISYLQLSIDDYVKKVSQKEIPKSDLISFYEETKKAYTVPEKRSGIIWTLDADKFGIQLSDAKIEEYYNKHKTGTEFQDKPSQVQVRTIVFAVDDAALKETIQKQAEVIHAQLLQDPSQFAQQARQLSTDSETKEKGGLMPPFAKGEMNPTLERTAFLLKSSGDISDVIETERGFEIVQLVEKKARTIKPLALVSDDIKKKLLNNAFKNNFMSEMRKVVGQKEHNAQAVQVFATSKQANQRTVNGVAANGSHELRTLFDIKKVGGISYYEENGRGVIVHLTDIKPPYIPSIADIEPVVKEAYGKHYAQKALENDLKQIQQLCATHSFEELHKQFGGVIAPSNEWIRVQDKEMLSKSLSKHLFDDIKKKFLHKDFWLHLEKVGATAVHLAPSGGIVIKVDALKEFDKADFDLKKESLSLELEYRRKQLTEKGFVASLYRNAKIETNNSIPALQK